MKSSQFIPAFIMVLLFYFTQAQTDRPNEISGNKYEDANNFIVYSNPAAEEIKIVFNSEKKGIGYLSIYTIFGVLLSEEKVLVMKGVNTWKKHLLPEKGQSFFIILKMNKICKKQLLFKGIK